MIITVYVNYNQYKVCSENEYKIMKNEIQEGYRNEDKRFNEWLNDNYSASDIWSMTDEQRSTVMEKYSEYLEEEADCYLVDCGWNEERVEV